MKNPYNQVINQYKDIELKTRVEAADPHELINLLLQGARTHIAVAQGNIARQETQQKCEHISKSLNIIVGLKTSLNLEDGGEMAENLMQIYEHVEMLLLKANLHNDAEFLIQSNNLLTQIHEAWQEISPNPKRTEA